MFPEDITEILQRLPLKSIFRFKCVSKGWSCLISKPSFKRSYELQSRGIGGNTCGFFYYDWKDDDDLGWAPQQDGPARFTNICERDDQRLPNSFDFIDTLGHVVASCKGLLLLTSPPEVGVAPRYFVCDPVTRKHVALPPTLEEYRFVSHGLLCEEDGHYKVVVFTKALPYARVVNIDIETYSSKTGQWNKSVITVSDQFAHKPYTVAQVIGDVLYWWEYEASRILAYDPNDPMQHGKLIEVPLHGYDEVYNDERITYHSYGISETKDGYLQYFRTEYLIEIFVLNEPTKSWYNKEDIIGSERWNLIHRIDSYNKLGLNSPFDSLVGVGFNPVDPQRLFLRMKDKVLRSYDYSNGEIDEVRSFEINCHLYYVFYQHPLWPCLC